MKAPAVHYVTTDDHYDIAYTVAGTGFPIVFLPPFTSHVQDVWSDGFSVANLLSDLSQRYQLVNYDSRGMGMSTRELGEELTLRSYLTDLEAVIGALDIERVALVGPKNFALLAANYACRHPRQVEALILMSAPFRWIPAIWEELPKQDWEEFLYSTVPHGYSAKLSSQMVDMFNRWTSQDNYLASVQVWQEARLESPLREIETPTLVMEPHGNESAVRTAREVADLLPRGRFAPIESGFAFGGPGEAIGAIEDFLSQEGIRSASPSAETNGAVPHLSRREMEVLGLVAAGKSNAQIAEELSISQHTVIRHVANIFAKIGVTNRTQAATYAHQHGLT
jgi:DNA-binding CsgD family transcriptional regulator/pimeloyl-ACP methyl ester carboxylesterase